MALLPRLSTRFYLVWCLAALLATPRAASAQGSVSDVLSFLVTNQAVITDDFVKDQAAAAATRDTIFRLLQIELSTLPINSSTGGFVYRLNANLGTMERASDSFGPFFLGRAVTSGRGQKSFGVTFRHSSFDTLDGRSLRDGSLVTIENRLAGESEPFDVETLSLRLEASTLTFFGSYGVTDRLDISAAVPVTSLSLSGERSNVYRGRVFQQAKGSASATGIADVALRATYSLTEMGRAGVAANVDLRLPTGDDRQLLGAGKTALHLSAIATFEERQLASHVRAGVAMGGVSDEIDFGAAVVFAATPRFNLIGEMFGRRLDQLARIAAVSAAHPLTPNVATTRLLPETIGTTTASVLGGFKWNVAGNWLVSGTVLLPLTETGLTGGPTPSFALDYTFD